MLPANNEVKRVSTHCQSYGAEDVRETTIDCLSVNEMDLEVKEGDKMRRPIDYGPRTELYVLTYFAVVITPAFNALEKSARPRMVSLHDSTDL